MSQVNFVSADRLNNFIVGLTNNPPAVMAPTTYGYMLCGQWPGVAAAGATLFVKCADNLPPARYVVIIGYSTLPLTICELEIYRATGKLSLSLSLSSSSNLSVTKPLNHHSKHARV